MLALICTFTLAGEFRRDWVDRNTSNHIPNRSDTDEKFRVRPVGAIVLDVGIQTHEAVEGLPTSVSQRDAASCTIIPLLVVNLNIAATIAFGKDARHDW